MPRSFNEIQKTILDAKAASAELTPLEVLTEEEKSILSITTLSKVAIWRIWVWIVSFAMWTEEQLWDVFKSEITTIVKNNTPHNEDWYKSKVLAFQYGHPLINDDEYEVIDEEAKKVKQAAVFEEDRSVVIKVATLDGDDLVKIDDTDVVDALTTYLNKVKDAGTRINLINQNADELKLNLKVYYDPLIIASNGSLTADGGTYPVFNPGFSRNADGEWDALQDYLRSIEFNGQYLTNKQIDFIQSIDGVIDVEVDYTGFKAGLSSDFIEFDRSYKPLAGYMKLSEINVEYIADV